MNEDRAVKLAIECIRKEIQRLAVDANLQEMYHADLPHTIAASKKRTQLREAILVLQGQPGKPKDRPKNPDAAQPELFAETNLS